MRLYRREEFLKLPPGVFYAKAAERWVFQDLCVKGDTVAGVDWRYRTLSGIDSSSTEQMLDRYEAMEQTGAAFPMAEGDVRDGMFDAGDLFLVLDRDDLATLRGLVDAAMEVT
jgi:hypothetical protein